jgi:2'-5' RNA ligase
MSRIRCFLGINFPIGITRRICDEAAALAAELKNSTWKIAWVPAANVHLTVKFFGMIEEASVEAIVGRLERELAKRASFDLEARAFGMFPDGNHPRVLWAGVKPQPALMQLQTEIEQWMEETGYPREARAYHPHITIGRVKEVGSPSLAPLLAARESMTFGTARAQEIVVYESRTHGANSEYVALGRVAIGRGAAAKSS